MSTKISKRKQKRHPNEDDLLEINEKNLSPKKIDIQLDQIFKDDVSEHSEISTETNEHTTETIEEQNGHIAEIENGQNGNHHDEENGQNDNHHDEENGFHEEITKEKLNENEVNIEIVAENVEIASEDDLLLSIDVPPEKQVEQPEEKSPVLTGRTTRSHKNSPNVEKTVENGMDAKLSNEVHVNLTQLDEKTLEKIENKTEEAKISEEPKVEETKEETEEKDTTNASIFVNVGNDTTHNIDITTTSAVEDAASFVDTNKDVPYAQAIRTLSGRRALRRDSPFVPNRGKSHLEKDATDSRRSYIPHISSVKRKNTSELPDDQVKRHKAEGSPGIFSYIASPLASFRNRMSRTELPSSTPKLTSYNKYSQGSSNIIEDMSQIEDLAEKACVPETSQTIEPKKWCSIM